MYFETKDAFFPVYAVRALKAHEPEDARDPAQRARFVAMLGDAPSHINYFVVPAYGRLLNPDNPNRPVLRDFSVAQMREIRRPKRNFTYSIFDVILFHKRWRRVGAGFLDWNANAHFWLDEDPGNADVCFLIREWSKGNLRWVSTEEENRAKEGEDFIRRRNLDFLSIENNPERRRALIPPAAVLRFLHSPLVRETYNGVFSSLQAVSRYSKDAGGDAEQETDEWLTPDVDKELQDLQTLDPRTSHDMTDPASTQETPAAPAGEQGPAPAAESAPAAPAENQGRDAGKGSDSLASAPPQEATESDFEDGDPERDPAVDETIKGVFSKLVENLHGKGPSSVLGLTLMGRKASDVLSEADTKKVHEAQERYQRANDPAYQSYRESFQQRAAEANDFSQRLREILDETDKQAPGNGDFQRNMIRQALDNELNRMKNEPMRVADPEVSNGLHSMSRQYVQTAYSNAGGMHAERRAALRKMDSLRRKRTSASMVDDEEEVSQRRQRTGGGAPRFQGSGLVDFQVPEEAEMNGSLSSYAGSKFSSDAATSSSSQQQQQQQQQQQKPHSEEPQEEEVCLPAVLNTETTGFVGRPRGRGAVNSWAPAAFSANGGHEDEEDDPRWDMFRNVKMKFNRGWFDVADMVEETNPI